MVSCQTEKKVQSGAYQALLNRLLKHDVAEITVDSLKSMLSENSSQVTLLDTRQQKEYDVSHLPDARYVGYEDFDVESVNTIDRDSPLVVYCSVGARSEKIARKLQEEGFTEVANLYGGLFEWVNRGYRVYDSSGITDSVHAYNRIWGFWLNSKHKIYK